MTDERKNKIKTIKEKIKGLTVEQINELSKRQGIVNVDGLSLSRHNQLMIYFQIDNAKIVGGYRQWQKVGRQVKKGEHGATILYPVGSKNETGEVDNDMRFFCATVFDISQTEAKEDKPVTGLTYQLTGANDEKCISNGNAWSESVVTSEPLANIGGI